MFCSSCGTEQPAQARFCITCGETLGAGEAPPAVEAPRPVVYAGFWLRVVAYLIDSVILSVPALLLALLVFAVAPSATAEGAPNAVHLMMLALLYVVLTAGGWLYFTLFECSSKQATPGKMALGIKVTDLEGKRISFGRANGRFWSKLISGLTLYIGFILAGFTERKQALHDMIAGCLVVKASEPRP